MKISISAPIATLAVCVAVGASSAFATCQLPSGATAGSCSYSGTGAGLTITDSNSSGVPYALEGLASGTNGRGILGGAKGKGGYGGVFLSDGTTQNANNTAIWGENAGGSTSAEANYGSAGVFRITNRKNQSPSVSIITNGINSQALTVVNSATIDENVEYVPPGQGPADFGGVAGYFEIDTLSASDHANQAAIFVVNSSGSKTSPNTYGAAGIFEITNPENNSAALQATSANNSGTAIYGSVGGNGIGVQGEADGSGGWGVYGQSNQGRAVYGFSASGDSGYFWSGSGGNGTCYFDGGATWSCTAPAAMMDDPNAPKYGELLDHLDAMPVNYYRLKGAKVRERYLGPSAEAFRAAFGLGRDGQSIRDGNGYGVALAAAQGLYRKLKADEATIATQSAAIATLTRQLAEQQAAFDALRAEVNHLTASVAFRREARADADTSRTVH